MQVIIAILSVISALLLAKLKSLLNENAKLREDLNSRKHEVYVEMADFLKSLIDGKAVEAPDIRMKELNGKIIFFASEKVLKASGDLMQHIYSIPKLDNVSAEKEEDNNFQTIKFYAELMVAIREDLGIDKRWHRVSWADIVRPTITDLNEYTPRRFSRNRKRRTLPIVRFKKHRKIVNKQG